MKPGLLAFVAAALAALGLAGCGSSTPSVSSTPSTSSTSSVSLPCAPQPQGELCLEIVRDKGKVTDVIAYLAASGPALTGMTWRLALGWGESGIAPGPAHEGNPRPVTYCTNGQINTTAALVESCGETLEKESASHGDFSGFDVPRASIPAPTCVHEQVRRHGKWVEGPATPACAG